MPTSITHPHPAGGDQQTVVSESIVDVVNTVHHALATGKKFVTFTNANNDKQFATEAANVGNIIEQ